MNNTLDWTFVTGFEDATLYEVSLDSGTNWSPVHAKPIIIGDTKKDVDQVHLRVAKNVRNGMPNGASASNAIAYTQTPKIAAPTNGQIVNTFDGDKPIQTNGFKWDYITTEIEGQSTRFDQPEYYEFTRDMGITWHSVVSRPQHIGSEAYDKSVVGIRLKKNAITGKANATSEVLWATSSSSRFIALKYVPMKTKNLTASFSYNDTWNTYDMNCIAEYDDQGQGEATYWAKYITAASDTVFSKVSEVTDCGITAWTLPKFDEVITLSNRDSGSLPSQLSSHLISNNKSNLWADKNGIAVTITKGAEVTPDSWSSKKAHPKWRLAPSVELLGAINTANTTIAIELATQASGITSAETYLTTWLANNQNKRKGYDVLEAEAQAKLTHLQAFSQPWLDESTSAVSKLNIFEFQASIARYRLDAQSQSFVTHVQNYKKQVSKLQQNLNGLNALIEGAKFAKKMAVVQEKSVALETAKDALGAASLATEIHHATLNLYNAIFDLENQYAQVDTLIDSLNSNTNNLGTEFNTLLALYQRFISELTTTANLHNLVDSKTLAKDGLKLASDSGFSVSKADALVSSRFVKLDELGHYLPSATTFQQGWRCVEDTDISNKRRVWSLLKDGLPTEKTILPMMRHQLV